MAIFPSELSVAIFLGHHLCCTGSTLCHVSDVRYSAAVDTFLQYFDFFRRIERRCSCCLVFYSSKDQNLLSRGCCNGSGRRVGVVLLGVFVEIFVPWMVWVVMRVEQVVVVIIALVVCLECFDLIF